MYAKIHIWLIAGALMFVASCQKAHRSCDRQVIISQDAYKSAPDDPVTIQSLKLKEGCLKIQFSSGGCNGQSWKVELIDQGTVAESNPPQRTLRLSLENKELCKAIITKEMTFDISSLRVKGSRSVWLRISDKSILYEY